MSDGKTTSTKPTKESTGVRIRIAAALGVSVERLGLDIKALAEYLEEMGNRGIPLDDLKRAGDPERPVPFYFLAGQYEDAIRGIIFYNMDEHYNGYMVRRNPPWMQVWCERYGQSSDASREDCETWQAAQEAIKRAQELAARPKRPVETFAEGRFEGYTTEDIGIRYAAARLLTARYELRNLEGRGRARRGLQAAQDRFALDVWREQQNFLAGELDYRTKLGDLEAAAILRGGPNRYYVTGEIEAIIAGEIEPGDVDPLRPLPPVPRVVHVRSRQWIDCPADERVYIGRKMKEFAASVWANPHKFKDEDGRVGAIRAYEHDLLRNPELLNRLSDLRGKRVIGCWCKSQYTDGSDHACHGDVLVEYLALNEDNLDRLIDEAAERQEDGNRRLHNAT